MSSFLTTYTSYFLKLPSEIRNAIYRIVLPPNISVGSLKHISALNLLQISSQVRAEARVILYSESLFYTDEFIFVYEFGVIDHVRR